MTLVGKSNSWQVSRWLSLEDRLLVIRSLTLRLALHWAVGVIGWLCLPPKKTNFRYVSCSIHPYLSYSVTINISVYYVILPESFATLSPWWLEGSILEGMIFVVQYVSLASALCSRPLVKLRQIQILASVVVAFVLMSIKLLFTSFVQHCQCFWILYINLHLFSKNIARFWRTLPWLKENNVLNGLYSINILNLLFSSESSDSDCDNSQYITFHNSVCSKII